MSHQVDLARIKEVFNSGLVAGDNAIRAELARTKAQLKHRDIENRQLKIQVAQLRAELDRLRVRVS